jgi:hypothetical protein
MTAAVRTRVLTCGLFTCLVAILFAGYSQMMSSRASAASAAHNLEACRRLSGQIASLREQPSLAALEARPPTELARRIEEAASSAQVSTDSILRIDPQAARRVGETAYKEQPTALELRPVNLKQLITLLLALTEGEDGLEVSALRITPPRREPFTGTDEVWHAEVTLTKLIFSPKTSQF